MRVLIESSELANELRKFERRGYNLDEVNEQLAQILHTMVEDKFEAQGPGWKRLAGSTLRRRRESKSPKMLQDTGDLVNSLQPSGGPDYAEVFTNKAYARYHLEGDGVPQRDFFDIDIEEALKTFDLIITEAIGRGFQ